MTLYRSMGRGSWIVQRRLQGLRVRHATGLYDRAQAEEFERVLLKLSQHGRLDLLGAFTQGQITGPELLSAVERYGMSFQLTVQRAIRLRRAMYEWLRGAELADKTRKDYRWNLGVLVGRLPPLDRPPTAAEHTVLQKGPELAELPRLLERYARKSTTKPVMFVQVKAACQSFVRDTVEQGRHSELWRAVAAVQGPRRGARRVQGGLSPERAREVAERLGKYGPVWWTLCCTGMGWKEYAGRWEVRPDRIIIHGTKREHRDRTVPRLTTPVRPLCSERTFRKALKGVGDHMGIPRLTAYVARRTFAHFLDLAGILDARCDLYMGHSPKSDREKYREHDVSSYLAGDAEAIRAKMGPEPRYMQVVA